MRIRGYPAASTAVPPAFPVTCAPGARTRAARNTDPRDRLQQAHWRVSPPHRAHRPRSLDIGLGRVSDPPEFPPGSVVVPLGVPDFYSRREGGARGWRAKTWQSPDLTL